MIGPDEPATPPIGPGGGVFALSLVTPTRGRVSELVRLLDSLSMQTRTDFELVLVDQNPPGEVADAVAALVAARRGAMVIEHLRTAGRSGAARARNAGLAAARGPLVAFPDDDSWYPPTLVGDLVRMMADDPGRDGLTFLCRDETGRALPGVRWDSASGRVSPVNLWRRGALTHTAVLRTEGVRAVGGFDERLGPPESSGEDTELLLRLLASGKRIDYDPSLWAHHPAVIPGVDAEAAAKAERYGVGLGRVLAMHGATPWQRWRVRLAPAARAAAALLRGDAARLRLERATLRGRSRGLRERLEPKPPASPGPRLVP
jgi:hypothetical protein